MIDLDIGNVINIAARLLTDKLSGAEAAKGPHVVFGCMQHFVRTEYGDRREERGDCFNFVFCLTAIQMILITRF